MSLRWYIIWLLTLSFGAGCSSLKKTCEQKNWYQHGYDLAMDGVRPAQDSLLQQCRKAEANISESQLDSGFKEGMNRYCQPEVAFQTGKRGAFLNQDLCDQSQVAILLEKHRLGVREYCLKENGYPVGASGAAYNKICPGDLEREFQKEFHRGRKKFLSLRMQQGREEIQSKQSEISRLEVQRGFLQGRLAGMPIGSGKERDPVVEERSRVEDELRSLGYQTHRLKSEAEELRKQVAADERELAALPD